MENNLYKYIKDALRKMIEKSYDNIERELLLDEFGTLNPYILIGKVWEERLLPDEKIFELIDEFGLDLNRFDRLKEAYQSKRAPKPTISPYLQDIVNSAKENKGLFFLDIGKLPKEITKETAIKLFCFSAIVKLTPFIEIEPVLTVSLLNSFGIL